MSKRKEDSYGLGMGELLCFIYCDKAENPKSVLVSLNFFFPGVIFIILNLYLGTIANICISCICSIPFVFFLCFVDC